MMSFLATAWLLVSYAIAKIVQHNKKLRKTLLKPYNKIIRAHRRQALFPICASRTCRTSFG